MLTANRQEFCRRRNVPLSIDAQYVVGFDWARQPAIADRPGWNETVWFGVSVKSSNRLCVEREQRRRRRRVRPGNGTVMPTVSASPWNNCNAADCSTTSLGARRRDPDVIEKPRSIRLGQFQAIGVERWFTDDVASIGFPFLPHGVAVSPSSKQETHFARCRRLSVCRSGKMLDLPGSV